MEGLIILAIIVVAIVIFRGRNQQRHWDDRISNIQTMREESGQARQPRVVTHYHEQVDVKGKKKKGNLVCPKCRSVNVDTLDNTKKGFSVGKAVAGGVLTSGTGGIGALAGFTGKKNKKPTMRCLNCGNTFKFKLK